MPDLTCRVEPVQERHRHVQHDDVGPELGERNDEGAPVRDLADDLAVLREHLLQGIQNQRVVVCEEDSWSRHRRVAGVIAGSVARCSPASGGTDEKSRIAVDK
ncbi:hypothetical protein TBR22_A00930 [Luteitalea sp. TBR-22]|nr:hypothetical protein TBR22_A00930 [Luteitalea sp. TBR-22]